jgi:hypothetical protein
MGRAIASAPTLNLPPPTTIVILEASNGTQSYFSVKLSDVPSGYDVTNATYLGWCIDQTAEMTRSPATHTVVLYSSLSPPGDLANENWSMVNYILNHKQGAAQDIQEAIWYFINLNHGYSPKSDVAWTMVNDAKTNGAGFVPTETQIAAVIAYPIHATNPDEVQISIIEVTIPQSETTPTPTPTPPPQTTPTPTPTPASQPNSPTPTPGNTNDGSSGSTSTSGTGNLTAIVTIVVLASIAVLVILLLLRRRKK